MRHAATSEHASLPDPALPPPPWAARVPRWTWILAYVAADRGLAALGYLLVDGPDGLAVVWPPAGLTLFALLVSRRRTWPALLAFAFVVSALGSVRFGRPPLMAAAYAAGNLAQAVAAWWVVVRLGGRPTLRTLRGALVLMLAPAATLAAVSAAAHLLLSAGAVAAFAEARFWIFWAGSSLGILVVTTLLVEWTTPGRPLLDGREAKLSAAAIAAAFAVAFAVMRVPGMLVDEVVLLPPLLWAAVRFGPRGATTALASAAAGVFATVGVGGGVLGAVAHVHSEERAIALQLFLALGAAPILVAAAVGAERRAAAQRRAVLERAFDQTLDPAGVLEEDGTVVWANQAMARQLGIGRTALVGRRLWELVTPTSLDVWRERWQRVAASRGMVVEEVRSGPDGRVVPWEISATVVDVGGRELMISVLRDLSDRRRAEEASRLAALGTLAAGVAHEINNPLAYVVANVSHVRERLATLGDRLGHLGAEVMEPLADAEDGARRVRDIVRQLRAFAHEDEQVGPVDVARAVPPAPAGGAAIPAPRAPAAPRRLLVVDDEPLVSRAVARILAAEGEIVVVDRGTDALARLRAGERFDAIVCDLMMPDLSGMELHRAVRELDPAIADRMVFVTGGAFTDAAREFLASVPNARLEKPLDVTELREAVRRV